MTLRMHHHVLLTHRVANDGLAYPFIYLYECFASGVVLCADVPTHSPLFWFLAHSEEEFHVSRGLGGVIGRWIYETWIYEIVLSVVLGALIGYVARKSLRFAEKRQWLDGMYSLFFYISSSLTLQTEDNFLAYGVGLAFFCLGFLGMVRVHSGITPSVCS
jgi:hypothetical protein